MHFQSMIQPFRCLLRQIIKSCKRFFADFLAMMTVLKWKEYNHATTAEDFNSFDATKGCLPLNSLLIVVGTIATSGEVPKQVKPGGNRNNCNRCTTLAIVPPTNNRLFQATFRGIKGVKVCSGRAIMIVLFPLRRNFSSSPWLVRCTKNLQRKIKVVMLSRTNHNAKVDFISLFWFWFWFDTFICLWWLV